MTGLITIKELLRDPQYRTYFTKVPQLPPNYGPANMPWKLMVLKPGETAWRTKRFGTYQEAFSGFKRMLPKINDAAINCPPLGFMPPMRTVRVKNKVDAKGNPLVKTIMWKPQISGDMEHHDWCPHCRRPTIFRMAGLAPRKRAGFELPSGEYALRCCICGASENIVNLRHPENAQKWDINRPKISKVLEK